MPDRARVSAPGGAMDEDALDALRELVAELANADAESEETFAREFSDLPAEAFDAIRGRLVRRRARAAKGQIEPVESEAGFAYCALEHWAEYESGEEANVALCPECGEKEPLVALDESGERVCQSCAARRLASRFGKQVA